MENPHLNYLEEAYKQALKALEENETPVGAVLVYQGKIIASSFNHSLKECDPTLHAEMNVIKQGVKILQTKNLSSCSLYVTLEPCLMCLGGIINSHIKEVYFGALDSKKGAFSYFNVPMNTDNISFHYLKDDRCGEIISEFFKKIRKTNPGDKKKSTSKVEN